MSNDIRLIVGLGNPGPEYDKTRHNAGFWFIESLANYFSVSLTADSKYKGLVARLPSPYPDVRLLMPQTFMNRSGQSVGPLAQFYKLEPHQILVVHDELDLPPGVAKLKQGGGHGGHNGLRDIISVLGNQKDFHRLRIGIGHPGHKDKVTGYVLGKPPEAERNIIDAIIDDAVRVVPDLLQGRLLEAKQSLHSSRHE
ncbi:MULTISPECIES: aminoacyl-tRNA hydrolase [Gammaproteobacteria]|uniref:aminoacyl-tRNA hydrolase n=1 Tax=Gammaproteobacteria TaxID=1236 RepID=UPI000DD0C2E7|nr:MULTISPECIES: aminoacyl-tRNA hydrolase [Gammaproteobacteria]RTE87435.1 aminoacyl-tRNA hydrolase [Aliidiomarina sp. B3213]TCZ92780.1 aminoacyl-tRNA hydrolase [Lysobacter sp. N42]